MNILVVGDHQIFRAAFVSLLNLLLNNKNNCAEAQNGLEAIEKLQREKFDLVFLHVSMPKIDGFDACERIRTEHASLPVIMLTQYDDKLLIKHFVDLGVHSFITKDASVEEMKAVLDSVRVREKKNSSDHLQFLGSKSVFKLDLTTQEKKLIDLLHQGKSSKIIADEMGLTLNTIRTYRDRLLEKTGTCNVAELISFGFNTGILTLTQKRYLQNQTLTK